MRLSASEKQIFRETNQSPETRCKELPKNCEIFLRPKNYVKWQWAVVVNPVDWSPVPTTSVSLGL